MALDKNDIELLRQMIREEITASENQNMTRIEKKLDAVIEAVNVTNERIDRLTNRVDNLNKNVLEDTWCVVKNPPQAQ